MSSETESKPPRLIAIGNFDGVHRGHQQVLQRAVDQANELDLVATVVTFSPHPAQLLRGEAPPLLTRLEQKCALLRSLPGHPDVVVLNFDQPLAQLSPESFVSEVLVGKLAAKAVLVGANFRFGRGRSGDLPLLQGLGRDAGFVAEAFPLAEYEGAPLSSTRIRNALSEGKLKLASEMLGRPHRLQGKVGRGDGRGRQLGFPTANLVGVKELLPPAGVYVVSVILPTSMNRPDGVLGVLHLGARPTVDRPASVEVHLIDFQGDLYDVDLKVDLLGHLRGVTKFEHLEALKQQIALDIQSARALRQAEGKG